MFSQKVKYKNKKYFSLLIVSVVSTYTFSQTILNHQYFVSPSINIGYTFKAGINFGFSVDAGLVNPSSNTDLKYGLNFSYYLVSTKLTSNAQKRFHALRSVNLMAQNNFVDVSLGMGRAKNKWGYGKRNKCVVRGVAADISFAYPNKYSPWIGVKTFHFNQPKWAWFIGPYNSVYAEYKYELFDKKENQLNSAQSASE